jgi:hypothetical protein
MTPVARPTRIVVARLRNLPALVIEDGFGMASFFFENDASTGKGGFDEWVTKNKTNEFERRDIEIINKTMRARSPYEPWERLYRQRHDWLRALHQEWDLVEMAPEVWSTAKCTQLLAVAIDKTTAKYVGRAMATKVLHMKRPRLVPILDRLVVETVGGNTGDSPTPTAALVDHLRLVATDNAAALEHIQRRLTGLAFQPTKVRILDAILWTAHPQSSLHADLGWPTRVGPTRVGSTRT